MTTKKVDRDALTEEFPNYDRYPFALCTSKIHGRGVFTLAPLPARRKIGEITGRYVRLPKGLRDVERQERIFFVEVNDRWGLDCSVGSYLGHVNHSCAPNCYLRIVNKRVECYTLRKIRANTELTIDYGATPHRDGMVCICGAKRCKGKL